MTYNQIMNEINQCRNLLEQKDHYGRKVAFEVAETLKELFPDVSLPNYEKYKENEAKAKALRNRINELEVALATAENDEVRE